MKQLLFILFILIPTIVFSQKRKTTKDKNVVFLNATYSHMVGNNNREIGDVYEFKVKALKNNIQFVSVWFGNTPVPCDFFELKKMTKVTSTKKNEIYILRANKNVFTNFSTTFDSLKYVTKTIADKIYNEVPFIIYTLNEKEVSVKTGKAIQVEPKPFR